MTHKIFFLSLALLLNIGVCAQKPLDIGKEYIQTHLDDWELERMDIAEIRVSNQYTSEHNGVTHIYLVQQANGIDVNNAMINLSILNGRVIFANSRFVTNLRSKIQVKQPQISGADAILSVALHLKMKDITASKLKETLSKHTFLYEGGAISQRDIKAQLKYVVMEGKVRLAWALDIDVPNHPDYWSIKVDALNAEILSQHNYTVYCNHTHHSNGSCREDTPTFHPSLLNTPNGLFSTYNVFPVPIESPIHGERALVENPADIFASPYGWHDIDGVPGPEYTITRGNNVHAYPDTMNTNESTGIEPDGGEQLLFDFPFQQGIEPDSFVDFATTQLFYMNNVMHDFAYSYGFTEAAGNFQQNNYGNGGSEEDPVIANAQDGGGSNNANFGTPADGGSGFMQMYTWSRNGLLNVTAPLSLAGIYETRTASFGLPISDTVFIAGEVVIADDGSGSSTLACNEIQNDLTGKIALIDRGECFFSTKVYHAELAGAVAAIICNYDGGEFRGMSAGSEDTITIPAIMLQYNDCLRLREVAGQQLTVEIAVPDDGGPSAIDGTLDNGIIAHEYGHGISNRLTGGATNTECLSNTEQMGEGWSDFFSLITTVQAGDEASKKRGIGSYVKEQEVDGAGIRQYPYSNSMDINPQTYADIIGVGTHARGEVWAVMLWDLYWAMSDKYGWSENLYHGDGGNNKAIQLVMDGMTLQACMPGFVDGRDAILAADRILYDGENQCLIWEVFARRGLGWKAQQGNSDDNKDGIEDFEQMPTCIQELKLTKAVSDEIEAGDDIVVTLTLTNHKAEKATGVKINDVLPEGVRFLELLTEDVAIDFSNSALEISLDELAAGESKTIEYILSTSEDLFSKSYFLDDLELDEENWIVSPIGVQSSEGNVDIWQLDPSRGIDNSTAWFIPSTVRDNDQGVELFEPILVTGEQPVLRFFHRYQTEWGNDGGIVQISNDGGNEWEIVDSKFFKNPYPTRLTYSAFAIPRIGGFTGENLVFHPSYVDLKEYIGQDILIRFRFGTDAEDPNASGVGFGWAVDNIEVMDMVNYNGEVCATSAEGDAVCAVAIAAGTIVNSKFPTATKEVTTPSLDVIVYPNPADNYINIDINAAKQTDIAVTVFTSDGKKVLRIQEKLQEGYNHLVVQIDVLSKGFYILEMRSNDAITFQKVAIAQ